MVSMATQQWAPLQTVSPVPVLQVPHVLWCPKPTRWSVLTARLAQQVHRNFIIMCVIVLNAIIGLTSRMIWAILVFKY